MEVQSRRVVLLTKDGSFVTCKKQKIPYEVGSEIHFTSQDVAIRRPYLKPIVTIALSLLLFFLFYKPNDKVMAYVSIDANPSIEASITDHLYVKDLKSYNSDGDRILKELKDWKGKPIQEVLPLILKQSEKDGLLPSGKNVIFTTVLTDKNDTSLQNKLESIAKSLQDTYKQEDITFTLKKGSLENREEAKNKGMSTGTYLHQQEEKNDPSSKQESSPPDTLTQDGSPLPSNHFPMDPSTPPSNGFADHPQTQEKKEDAENDKKGNQAVSGHANAANSSTNKSDHTDNKGKGSQQRKDEKKSDNENQGNQDQNKQDEGNHKVKQNKQD